MPALTIMSNLDRSKRSTIVVDVGTPLDRIYTAAKCKLRLKKPKRAFDINGNELIDTICDALTVLVSCGEDFIGTKTVTKDCCEMSIVAKESFVDKIAVDQLTATARLDGMISVIGMPDLHPGPKTPIGAQFISTVVRPELVGGDIGCGMSVYKTKITLADVGDDHVKKLARKITGLEGQWDGDIDEFLSAYLTTEEIGQVTHWHKSLGTIGGGNHFAELQSIDSSSELDGVVLVVHTGSRGLGKEIVDKYNVPNHPSYLPEEAHAYLREHDLAIRWARANRDLVAFRFLNALYSVDKPDKLIDVCHNRVERVGDTFVHVKGATRTSERISVIPGSRGTLTAYVIPTSATTCMPHGAGRSQSRTATYKHLKNLYRPNDLYITKLKGFVICEDETLIYEEAPEGYKDIDSVVQDAVSANLCTVVAWGVPRISYKVRKSH